MKFILSLLTVAFFSCLVWANITSDQQFLLNHEGTVGQKTQLGTLLNKTSALLIAKYSYAVQGGSTAADVNLLTSLTDKKSFAVLPNKAIITNVWLDVLTQPVSSGSATVAVKAVNAGDLLAATAKASLPVALKQGVPNGATTSTWIKLSAQKTIKATVGTAPLTAGKFNVYIEYVIGD